MVSTGVGIPFSVLRSYLFYCICMSVLSVWVYMYYMLAWFPWVQNRVLHSLEQMCVNHHVCPVNRTCVLCKSNNWSLLITLFSNPVLTFYLFLFWRRIKNQGFKLKTYPNPKPYPSLPQAAYKVFHIFSEPVQYIMLLIPSFISLNPLKRFVRIFTIKICCLNYGDFSCGLSWIISCV